MDQTDKILLFAMKNRMLRAVEMLTTAQFPRGTGDAQIAYEKMISAVKLLESAAEKLNDVENPGRRKSDKPAKQ